VNADLQSELSSLRARLAAAERNECPGHRGYICQYRERIDAEVKRRLTGKGHYVDPDLSEWRGECGHVWRKSQTETCPLCDLTAARKALEKLEPLALLFDRHEEARRQYNMAQRTTPWASPERDEWAGVLLKLEAEIVHDVWRARSALKEAKPAPRAEARPDREDSHE
jgi:hypothetical protein